MKTLPVIPITQTAFAPFGVLLDRRAAETRSINQGTTTRFHHLAAAEIKGQGNAILSIFRATRRPSPMPIALMERHPLGSQAFFPLSPHPWLALVAEDANGKPDPNRLHCFRVPGNQGVQYAANIWHHPLLVLEPEQDFLVMDREGQGDNLEEHWFEKPVAQILAD